jgi:hypothetical protein
VYHLVFTWVALLSFRCTIFEERERRYFDHGTASEKLGPMLSILFSANFDQFSANFGQFSAKKLAFFYDHITGVVSTYVSTKNGVF